MYFDSESFNNLIRRKVNILFLLDDDGIGLFVKDLLKAELIQAEKEIKAFTISSAWALS